MIKTIGIFGKYQDISVKKPLESLTQHLEKKGIVVKIGYTTAAEIASNLPHEKIDEHLPVDIDLAVVIGGDGTLLHVARRMAESDIPIAGINLGRLGFLTDISQKDMLEEMDNILAGKYQVEERMMLDLQVINQSKTIYRQTALNDVVLGKHLLERILHWDAYINNEFVTSARSDGVILSTPTGSTAYSLSAGGAIMHPGVHVISMVPISPHTLSNRPIGIPGDAVIELKTHNNSDNAHVSCDGLIGHEIKMGDTMQITQSKYVAKLIHTDSYSYFNTLRMKLGWGNHQ